VYVSALTISKTEFEGEWGQQDAKLTGLCNESLQRREGNCVEWIWSCHGKSYQLCGDHETALQTNISAHQDLLSQVSFSRTSIIKCSVYQTFPCGSTLKYCSLLIVHQISCYFSFMCEHV